MTSLELTAHRLDPKPSLKCACCKWMGARSSPIYECANAGGLRFFLCAACELRFSVSQSEVRIRNSASSLNARLYVVKARERTAIDDAELDQAAIDAERRFSGAFVTSLEGARNDFLASGAGKKAKKSSKKAVKAKAKAKRVAPYVPKTKAKAKAPKKRLPGF